MKRPQSLIMKLQNFHTALILQTKCRILSEAQYITAYILFSEESRFTIKTKNAAWWKKSQWWMCCYYHAPAAGSAPSQDHAPAPVRLAGQQWDPGHPAEQQKAASRPPLRKPPLEFFVCFQVFFLKTEDIKWFNVISGLGKFRLPSWKH